MSHISRKIVLIGDFSTGKTSLIRRFVENQFSDRYLSTIGVKVSKKQVIVDDKTYMLLIWDIEGGTAQKPLNTTYLKGAHGAIVVADITRRETMEHIGNYLDALERYVGKVPSVVAYNKCDLLDRVSLERFVSQNEETSSSAIPMHYVSAKTGEGVESMFLSLAQALGEV